MQYLRWICWLFWVGLPLIMAYPIPSQNHPGENQNSSSEWEHYSIQYTIGLLSVTATAFTLVGCLCCHRHRQRKGFRDKAEKYRQEFKDGNSIVHETGFNHTLDGLELSVPTVDADGDRIQFEPLPVEHIISRRKALNPKPLPLAIPSFEERDTESNGIHEVCSDWFNIKDLEIPRERLKYLRELGHGWFGKVVEGQAELDESKKMSRSGSVVVRILSEEATMNEKAWFLGEATIYLKLQHPNILSLYGCCLEADPYLLLFESCSVGNVKGFLLSNHDKKSQEALKKENVPMRMALDIAAGLNYMHKNGFVHTDLAARNCLVASDLSVKVGDYGTAVEKYPMDYYILSDRALPIRWSAPESIECTDIVIETREITSYANIYTYGIVLWEIFMWGKRPYDNKSDEEVIQMLLSLKTNCSLNNMLPFQNEIEIYPPHVNRTIQLCMNINAKRRPDMNEVRDILLNEYTESMDFDHRWENVDIHAPQQLIRSASLQDLRGSIDSDFWTTIVDDNHQQILPPPSLKLQWDESVQESSNVINANIHQESDSETEESWRGRIEQGVYTEKVKQKSKSVTDLMVLVHIDFDSDAELSLGATIPEKIPKKTTGSDSDLRHNTHADEFTETLRKLRDPLPSNTCNKIKSLDNPEQPKFLTLTMDQTQMPILRLSLEEKNLLELSNSDTTNTNVETMNNNTHVLRLLTKGDSDHPFLCYVPDTLTKIAKDSDDLYSDSRFVSTNSIKTEMSELIHDDTHINERTDSPLVLQSKGLTNNLEFNEHADFKDKSPMKDSLETDDTLPETKPDTERSVYNAEEDFSTCEELDAEGKCVPIEEEEEVEEEEEEEEEEDRKHLSTPDDEQSSDSGFRDKESCEEEENVCASSVPESSSNVPTVAPIEDEQLQILFELDTILDAEYNATFTKADTSTPNAVASNDTESKTLHSPENNHEIRNALNFTEEAKDVNPGVEKSNVINETCNLLPSTVDEEINVEACNVNLADTSSSSIRTVETDIVSMNDENDEHDINVDQDHEDEDSSTMSLRSDNSYMSFGIDEEFVTAIRNELREKLPCAQMPVVEALEAQDDENPSISSDTDIKQWDYDDNEESCSGGVGISIRYNVYGTLLSPILEERESTVNSESLISNSRDASLTSKDSGPSEDVLLVDTRTNKMILLEGLAVGLEDDDRDTTNEEFSEEENMDYLNTASRVCEDKSRFIIPTGGAPLPSPEEESKWQQLPPSFPLPSPLQDDLISTSFARGNRWGGHADVDDDNEDDDEELDEDNSSSSGEFIWKRYDAPLIEQTQLRSALNDFNVIEMNDNAADEVNADDDEGEEEQEGIEEEEEFTPSAWDASLAPHRSALRSPDKTLKSGEQKKSVCFKKQRYHCVYEYPKETTVPDSQAETSSEPTSYTDWEQMMEEPRLDLYSLDYDDTNCSGSEEFFVSSTHRPFQFSPNNTKYVSQFFPGAVSTTTEESVDDVDSSQHDVGDNNIELPNDYGSSQQYQLGELRHTRNRLTLNLLSANGVANIPLLSMKAVENDDINELDATETEEKSVNNVDLTGNQLSSSNTEKDNLSPNVPLQEIEETGNLNSTSFTKHQCDSQ